MLGPDGVRVAAGRDEPVECRLCEETGMRSELVLHAEADACLPLQGRRESLLFGIDILPADEIAVILLSEYRYVQRYTRCAVSGQVFICEPIVGCSERYAEIVNPLLGGDGITVFAHAEP